jgi:hypothetical protein
MGVYLKYFEDLLVQRYEDELFMFPLLIVTTRYMNRYEQASGSSDQFYLNLSEFRKRLSMLCNMRPELRSKSIGAIMANCCLKDNISSKGEKTAETAKKDLKKIVFNEGGQFPKDFQEVVDAAKKIEMKLLIQKNSEKMPPSLVSEAEIKIAGAEGNLEVLVAQVVRLEWDLKNQPHSAAHKKVIDAKIIHWKRDLSTRVSELILDSDNVESLKTQINIVFKNELSGFKKIILSQIDFLENQHFDFLKSKNFFIDFYQNKSMSDKYDCVCAVEKRLKENKMVTHHLNIILGSLIQQIIEKEYQFIAAEQNRLMELPDSTIAFVFHHLREWASNDHCLSFKRKALFKVLMEKIDEKQAEAEAWGKLNDKIVSKDPSLSYRTYQPLMRDVYTMRYLNHPKHKHKHKPKSKPVLNYSSSDEDQSDSESDTSDNEGQESRLPMAALFITPKK